MRISGRILFAVATTLVLVVTAQAHIRINPTESVAGGREKYTMRAPNEKQVDCIRIEGEFPAGLKIYGFEFKPGWKLDIHKNAAGDITGATWTGRMQPYEFVEFGMLGVNPANSAGLVWKFVQYYADGNKEEFSGPVGSKMPSPVTRLNPAPAAAAPAPPPASAPGST